MNFLWATINVNNLKETLNFYQNIVGLEIQKTLKMGDGNSITFLGDGETKLEIICSAEFENVDYGNSISLGFEVDSLEDKMEHVKNKGIEIHSGPFSPAPGTKFFFVLDPNGLKIQFVEILKIRILMEKMSIK